MNAKQWAEKLNGREYGSELSRDEAKQAKADGVVIVYGYSDDNVELRGVIDDEIGAWNGRNFRVDRLGVLPTWDQIRDGDMRETEVESYFRRKAAAAIRSVNAECDAGGYSWLISVDGDYEPFDIMEDGEKFCRGIVFELEGGK